MKEREENFNINCDGMKFNEYESLRDINLRRYYENPNIQKELYSKGLIDSSGNLIQQHLVNSKLNAIEQEFKRVERELELKRREEIALRVYYY